MKYKFIIAFCSLLWLLTGCHRQACVPEEFTVTHEKPLVFPDYTDITCPYNIAPLNFQIMNRGKSGVVEIKGENGNITIQTAKEGKIIFNPQAWKTLLEAHKGKQLTVHIYIREEKGWKRLLPFFIEVASAPIDPYLSYRLIEPGYIAFRRLGIYQRNLENFEVKAVYENNEEYDDKHNHCINCHNYQNYDTQRMLLHVRANHSGTVIADNGHLKKVQFPKTDIPFGAVYPAWHPERPYIAFSSNRTGQSFHIHHPEKVEVNDMESDLILYDHEKGTVRYILRTDSVMETFPHWHPDGTRLYYTAAEVPDMKGLSPDDKEVYTIEHYNDLRYDIMVMDFDSINGIFGKPHRLTEWAKQEKSVSVVRVSPDGKYLLYTLADYGQFHIWHKSADLWILDLQTGENSKLEKANSNDADSYHSWSSNGRWIAFSSRRDDGSFTRCYISYFDPEGKDRKAFMIPQQDPEENILLMKSYNVPELTQSPVKIKTQDFQHIIMETEAQTVKFISEKP